MFNNLSKKMKIILLSSLAGVMTLFFALGIGFSIPDMGLESLKFINSVEKQIDQKIPKNKFVLDGQGKMFSGIMQTGILNTYIADAVSTINFYESNNSQQLVTEYTALATEWFNQRWGEAIKNQRDVDLNAVSHDLIEFDKSIAEKYHNFGYVHTGLAWMFKANGISSILSQETRNDALQQQTIIKQDDYNAAMEYKNTIPDGLKVINSAGTYIVNNKVWFFNAQNETIGKMLGLGAQGLAPFKNKALTEKDQPANLTPADLYHPNFTLGISLAKTGFAFLIVLTPIVFAIAIPMIVLISIKRK